MSLVELLQLPAHEIVGSPDGPVVVALGGISATRRVTQWWRDVAGPRRALDTDRFRVLGVDFLDGGAGPDGRPERIVTTHDQADALVAVLDALGIERVHAIAGASYGGMVALAFAERYPDRVERLVAISAPASPHPLTTGIRAIQRRLVELGLETGRASDALALARALAMTTYRSAREFAERFDATPSTLTHADAVFPAEAYLRHHGAKFGSSWNPARFLALSLSADLHRVDPARITTPTLLVAAEGDTVVPREQLELLAAGIAAPVRLADLATLTGHDAFLTEPAQVGALLATTLTAPVPA